MSSELDLWMHTYFGLVFGVAIAVLGIGLRRRHAKTWLAWQRDRTIAEGSRTFYRRQYRRRVQVAGLLITIGTLISAGDFIIDWRRVPTLFAIYWGAILMMSLWVMLLAISDLLSSGTHSRHSLSMSKERLEHRRSELDRIRQQHRP